MKNITNKVPKGYREDINRAVEILRNAGCTEIFLFGSIAEGKAGKTSDIDLAVRGCSANNYFHLLGKLMLELNHPVDLVNLDKGDEFSKYLLEEGELLNVS